MNYDELSNILSQLCPAKRLKYIRQKVLKQNQDSFCYDGIIRSGTLKSIEIGRMKIGNKIADKLVHKLSLNGIICEPTLFLKQDDLCDIKIDNSKKDLIGDSVNSLEDIRKKITQLIPIRITNNEYAPSVPQGTTLLVYEATRNRLEQLDSTLCFIKSDKSSLYYLTYKEPNLLIACMNNNEITIPTSIIDFCTIFVVEIIYFGGTANRV